MEKIVIVQCMDCGKKQEIGAGEIGKNEVPMCESCGGIMMPLRAELREDVF